MRTARCWLLAMPRKLSYLENCETSAVGRALGMLGYGIDGAICSAEERANRIDTVEDLTYKPDRVGDGDYYNQGDIHDKLDEVDANPRK